MNGKDAQEVIVKQEGSAGLNNCKCPNSHACAFIFYKIAWVCLVHSVRGAVRSSSQITGYIWTCFCSRMKHWHLLYWRIWKVLQRISSFNVTYSLLSDNCKFESNTTVYQKIKSSLIFLELVNLDRVLLKTSLHSFILKYAVESQDTHHSPEGFCVWPAALDTAAFSCATHHQLKVCSHFKRSK